MKILVNEQSVFSKFIVLILFITVSEYLPAAVDERGTFSCRPDYIYSNLPDFKLHNVELTADTTRLTFRIPQGLNVEHFFANSFLVDEKGKRYPVNDKGTPRFIPVPDEEDCFCSEFLLTFPAFPDNTTSFDFVGGYEKGALQIYGIHHPEEYPVGRSENLDLQKFKTSEWGMFAKDTVCIRGRITIDGRGDLIYPVAIPNVGYDYILPRLRYEQSVFIHLDADGNFETRFVTDHPIWNYISCVYKGQEYLIPFYVRPGETLQIEAQNIHRSDRSIRYSGSNRKHYENLLLNAPIFFTDPQRDDTNTEGNLRSLALYIGKKYKFSKEEQHLWNLACLLETSKRTNDDSGLRVLPADDMAMEIIPTYASYLRNRTGNVYVASRQQTVTEIAGTEDLQTVLQDMFGIFNDKYGASSHAPSNIVQASVIAQLPQFKFVCGGDGATLTNMLDKFFSSEYYKVKAQTVIDRLIQYEDFHYVLSNKRAQELLDSIARPFSGKYVIITQIDAGRDYEFMLRWEAMRYDFRNHPDIQLVFISDDGRRYPSEPQFMDNLLEEDCYIKLGTDDFRLLCEQLGIAYGFAPTSVMLDRSGQLCNGYAPPFYSELAFRQSVRELLNGETE